jgi:hypothetical protein
MKQTYIWGALTGLLILIETIAGNKLELFNDPGTKVYILVINLLTLGVSIYFALRDFKQRNEGLISFARCVFNGMLISALAGIITSIGYVTYYKNIEPQEIEKSQVAAEQFFVKEKDSSANTVAEYKAHFIKNYTDTVHTTQADMPQIEKMASDSAQVVQTKVNEAMSLFTFSVAVITFTGPLVIIGLLLSVIVASVIANKKV